MTATRLGIVMSTARATLSVEDLRRLGVPRVLMSDFEFRATLHRDRSDDHLRAELPLDAPWQAAHYDRRGLLNVIAWLVANLEDR